MAVATAFAGPAPASAAPAEPDSADAAGHSPQFTVMTPATAVAARTDRRPVAGGLYDKRVRKTFITWAGQHEDNYAQAYDHRRGTWSAPVKVGNGEGDSHNYPTIVQADDGHLLVFHSLHNAELVVARSPRPHSVEGTWTEQLIPEGKGATYPMPFKTANGDIFVFIRETVRDLDPTAPPDLRPMKYVRSTDNGRTWRNSAQLTGDRWAIAPTDRVDNMNEIYIGQLRYEPAAPGRPERVHIVYTLAGGGPEGNLHDRYHRNIYHVQFTPRDLRFRAASGADVGTSIDDAEQERHLRVAETPLQPAPFSRSPDYIQLVGTIAGHLPFVVWMQLDAAGVLHDHSALWTPAGWHATELGTGARVRDMEPLGPFLWRVYATREGVVGVETHLLWLGVRWQPGPLIPTAKPVQRVDIIAGHRDPARIIASGASSAREVAVADGDIYVAGVARR